MPAELAEAAEVIQDPAVEPQQQAPPVEQEPKKPSQEEELNSRLAGIHEKWDKLIQDGGEDGQPAAEPAVDAGDTGSDAEDVVPTGDIAERKAVADKYGVSVERLKGFTSAKDADEALSLAEQLYFGGYEPAAKQQPPPQQQAPGQQPVAEPPTEAEQLLTLEDWDEDEPIRKNFSALEGKLKQQTEELQFVLQQVDALLYEREYRDLEDRGRQFQQHLSSLDEERYGNDSTQDAQQLANREYLATKINEFVAGQVQQGRPVPTDVRRIAEGLHRTLFGAQKKKATVNGQKRAQLGQPGRAQPRSLSPSSRLRDFEGDPRKNPAIHEIFSELERQSALEG